MTAADSSSVTVEWPPARDNQGVVGYGIYVNGAKVGTETPDQVTKRKDRERLSYTVGGLACGTGYTIGVDAFDQEDNHSLLVTTTVSTAACRDTAAPSPPTAIHQVATTEDSVVLAWSPSSDNVGVVEYGLYDSGLRIATVSEATATLMKLSCGKTYLIGIDAADAAGNRSSRVDSYFTTSPCPTSNRAPSTPTRLRVTTSTQTSVSLAWTASTDDVGVAGYGLYRSGTRIGTTTATGASFSGLHCGSTYTLGVDAFDAAGARSAVAQLSAATSPCATTPPPTSSGGTLRQTIADGATLSGGVTWRAVYDGNGDNVPDDPGSVRFFVDGKVVLTEALMPFGDTAGFFASGSVANGRHDFEVRAISDTGTVVATNTVTATISNSTTTDADTEPPTPPTGMHVVTASGTGITVAWTAATDNVGVTGYDTYRGTGQVGQTQQTSATYDGLMCGTSYQLGVDAYDAAGNKSTRVDLTATTAACADTQPPTAPTNIAVSNRTTTSIALTWAPSTDNSAVGGYGVYNAGELVYTTAGTAAIIGNLTCGTNYTLAVDAFDTAGNSSPKTTLLVSTLACADAQPPTAPTNVAVSTRTTTSITLAWTPSTDGVGVAGYGIYNGGSTPAATTTGATGTVTGLTCGTSYALAVDAFDAAGNRSTKTNVTASTLACATVPTTGYPDAASTGVPAGTVLTAYTGPSTITVPNTVIDGKTLGCVEVQASGVVIRNSRVSCRGDGVEISDKTLSDGQARLLIEDSEISCQDVPGSHGISEADFVARRVEITHCENGFDANQNILVEDSYIHDLWNGSTSHLDGMQLAGGHWNGSAFVCCALNITVRHNTMYGMGDGDTSFGTSSLISNPAGDANILIESNLFAGGSYNLYCPGWNGNGAKGTNYVVRDNHFSTRFKSTVGWYGISQGCSDETQSGNVIHETGQALKLG